MSEVFQSEHPDERLITELVTGLTPDIVEPIIQPVAEVAEAADTAFAKAKRLAGAVGCAVVSMVRVALTGEYE